MVKFGFSEKATKFEKIFVVHLTRASCSVHATAYLSKSRRRFFKTNVDKWYCINFTTKSPLMQDCVFRLGCQQYFVGISFQFVAFCCCSIPQGLESRPNRDYQIDTNQNSIWVFFMYSIMVSLLYTCSKSKMKTFWLTVEQKCLYFFHYFYSICPFFCYLH